MDKEVSCHQSCGIRDCFPRVKWLESEADHLPYSSAVVKNVWRNSSARSIHGDNFTFTCRWSSVAKTSVEQWFSIYATMEWGKHSSVENK
jgi:hypothetical protein